MVTAAATVVLTVASPAQAQNLARVSFEYRAPTGPTDPEPGSEDAELTTYQLAASFVAPWVLSPEVTLLLGAAYGWFRTEGEFRMASGREDFHEVGVTAGANFRLDPQWTLGVLVGPSLASDFEQLRGRSVNLRALVQAGFRSSERLLFSFGVIASYELGELLPLPLLEITWDPTPRDRLRAGIPRGLHYAHTFRDRVEAGAALRLTGGRWDVTEVAESLRTTSLDLIALTGVRLAGGLWWELFGGVALVRNVEVSARQARDGFLGSRLDPSLLIGTALSFRAPRTRSQADRALEPQPEAEGEGETSDED